MTADTLTEDHLFLSIYTNVRDLINIFFNTEFPVLALLNFNLSLNYYRVGSGFGALPGTATAGIMTAAGAPGG
jgi:hypothetical protein